MRKPNPNRGQSLFDKNPPTVKQSYELARIRRDDATVLLQASQKKRGGTRRLAAIYLAGLSLEAMLKAKLLDLHPEIRLANPVKLTGSKAEIYAEVFKYHRLDRICALIKTVDSLIEEKTRDKNEARRLQLELRELCAQWTIYVRYSTLTPPPDLAGRFITLATEIQPCLANH